MDWGQILGWGSPIGSGIFLVLMGTMVFLLTKAAQISQNTKQMKKDKEKDPDSQ